MTTNHVSLFAGLLVGLSIAIPIGPMGLLCIQRTLAFGMRAGVSTGLGGATVNVLYAALIIFGLDTLAPSLASGGRVLTFAGGLYLLWSAARTALRRRTPDGDAPSAALSPLAAYGSAVALNATNPMAPVLMMALLAPMIELSSPSSSDAAQLLFGIFAAVTGWWVCLTGGITLLRSRLSPRMVTIVNQVAATLLAVYGAAALAKSAGL